MGASSLLLVWGALPPLEPPGPWASLPCSAGESSGGRGGRAGHVGRWVAKVCACALARGVTRCVCTYVCMHAHEEWSMQGASRPRCA